MSIEVRSTGISSVKVRFRPSGPAGPAGRSIVSGAINGSGHLILTMSDSTTVDAGSTIGNPGPTGRGIASVAVNGSGHLIITYTDASTLDAGAVIGPTGATGRGVASAALQGGALVLTYTDGTSANLGNVTGPQGNQGIRGPAAGLSYTWAAAIDNSDPGAGKLKVNSLSRPAVTQLYISETDAIGIAAASLLSSLSASTSANRALITIYDSTTPTNFVSYYVTGAGVDNGAWRSYPVSYLDHSGAMTDGAAVSFQWSRTGDKGDQGLQGLQGIQGTQGSAVGIPWTFSSATADADPGNGTFRIGAATYSAATSIYFDDLDANGSSASSYLDSFDDSTNASIKGELLITQVDNAANYVVFAVTGAVVNGTGYRKVPVAWRAGNGVLTGRCAVNFSPAGDKGLDGAGGDVFGTAAAGVNNQAVVFDTDGHHLKSAGYAPGSLAQLSTINGSNWSGTDLAVADGGTGASSASVARTNLGLAIGTDVQAFDATLQSLAALGTASDRMAYTTATDTWAETAISALGRTLVGNSTTGAMQSTLGLGALAAKSTVTYGTGDVTGFGSLAALSAVGTALITDASVTGLKAAAGFVIDRAFAEYTASANLTTAIPGDGTTAQITEGTQVATVSLTPKATTSRLRVRVVGSAAVSTQAYASIALFVNGAASAVRVRSIWHQTADAPQQIGLEYEYAPLSTSTQTFALRAGPSTGTMRMNGGTSGVVSGPEATTLVVEEIRQ
jgi:hypothetical protein